jgi:hypothetical protein
MRSTFIVLGILVWLGVGVLWLFPRKLELLRRHGMHLTNNDLIRLGPKDRDAWNLQRDTWAMIAIGLVGGIAIVLTR